MGPDPDRSTLPPENVYGHTKKLSYILLQIDSQKEKLGRPVRVLDFGCGNGSAVSQYLIQDGVDYVGVDIHQPSLDYAKTRYSDKNAIFTDETPKDQTFDLIVYADFLEHVTEPWAFLSEHQHLLSDDGYMIASVPNGYGPFELEQRIDKFFKIDRGLYHLSRFKRFMFRQPPPSRNSVGLPYNHESGHVIFFTKSSLIDCLTKAGLTLRDFRNGSFMGASISGIVMNRSKWVLRKNVEVADTMPYWMVSTWLFTMGK